MRDLSDKAMHTLRVLADKPAATGIHNHTLMLALNRRGLIYVNGGRWCLTRKGKIVARELEMAK